MKRFQNSPPRELGRSIHWNPVRAERVRRPADYIWSRHRAYLGLARSAWVESEVELRYFGARRQRAREVYRAFINAGIKQGHRDDEPTRQRQAGCV